jgi:hypothetical protein
MQQKLSETPFSSEVPHKSPTNLRPSVKYLVFPSDRHFSPDFDIFGLRSFGRSVAGGTWKARWLVVNDYLKYLYIRQGF